MSAKTRAITSVVTEERMTERLQAWGATQTAWTQREIRSALEQFYSMLLATGQLNPSQFLDEEMHVAAEKAKLAAAEERERQKSQLHIVDG